MATAALWGEWPVAAEGVSIGRLLRRRSGRSWNASPWYSSTWRRDCKCLPISLFPSIGAWNPCLLGFPSIRHVSDPHKQINKMNIQINKRSRNGNEKHTIICLSIWINNWSHTLVLFFFLMFSLDCVLHWAALYFDCIYSSSAAGCQMMVSSLHIDRLIYAEHIQNFRISVYPVKIAFTETWRFESYNFEVEVLGRKKKWCVWRFETSPLSCLIDWSIALLGF